MSLNGNYLTTAMNILGMWGDGQSDAECLKALYDALEVVADEGYTEGFGDGVASRDMDRLYSEEPCGTDPHLATAAAAFDDDIITASYGGPRNLAGEQRPASYGEAQQAFVPVTVADADVRPPMVNAQREGFSYRDVTRGF